MSLIRGTKCSHDALEFGGAVVRLAYGGPVEEPLRERTLATLRLMDLPVPSSVGSGTLYEYARLYDQLMGVVGAVRARDRRERRRLAVCWSAFVVFASSAAIAVGLRFGWSLSLLVALVALQVARSILRRPPS